jgi:hypothetical protein
VKGSIGILENARQNAAITRNAQCSVVAVVRPLVRYREDLCSSPYSSGLQSAVRVPLRKARIYYGVFEIHDNKKLRDKH